MFTFACAGLLEGGLVFAEVCGEMQEQHEAEVEMLSSVNLAAARQAAEN
jgi:hypothetical protein